MTWPTCQRCGHSGPHTPDSGCSLCDCTTKVLTTPRYVCGAASYGPGYEHHCPFSTDDKATAWEHWRQRGHWVDGLDNGESIWPTAYEERFNGI